MGLVPLSEEARELAVFLPHEATPRSWPAAPSEHSLQNPTTLKP